MYSLGWPGLRDIEPHILNSWIVLSRALDMMNAWGCSKTRSPSGIARSAPYAFDKTTRTSLDRARRGRVPAGVPVGAGGDGMSFRLSRYVAYWSRVRGVVPLRLRSAVRLT